LPDILGPGQLSRERFQSLGSFRENLKHVPVGFCHDVKNLLDEIIRDGFMKEVTHTIDENLTRPFPPQRESQLIWVKSDLETIPIARIAHRL
jgi:hypothetical protein